MGTIKTRTTTVYVILFTCLSMLICPVAKSDAGDFWYGLFGTFNSGIWGSTLYDTIRSDYRMNIVIDRLENQNDLNLIKDAGLKVIAWPYSRDGDDTMYVFRYSNSFFIHYQAELDTIGWQWEPSGGWGLVRARGGSKVPDAAFTPDSGYAWFFDPVVDTPGSDVYARVPIFRAQPYRHPQETNVSFRFRAIPDSTSEETLFKYGVRNGLNGTVYVIDTVDVADVAFGSYQTYNLYYDFSDTSGNANSWCELFLQWAGTDSLWVDFIAEGDNDGIRLASGTENNVIKDFVAYWTFNDDPAIIGFWLCDEVWADGNVLPQKLVEDLIKEENSRLFAHTEQHYLYKWENTPGTSYGGRSVASARVQNSSHVSNISYPFKGLNPYAEEVTPDSGLVYRASKAVWQEPGCEDMGSDTAICFQLVMDDVALQSRFWKGFCKSIDISFIPYVQAYAARSRIIPSSCSDDTTWYNGTRIPTENEAKCHAAVLLASGANGLLYFRAAGHRDSVLVDLPCEEDPFWYVYDEYTGLTLEPSIQNALKNWVGPFIDSLGHYFADFNWQGGGRLDVSRDSVGLSALFDSTARSLTFIEAGDSAYIEAGVYTLDGETNIDYFLLVNRRAYDTIPQEVLVWLDPSASAALYKVTDLYSKEVILVGPMGGSNDAAPFVASIDPGEAKLFRVESAGYSSVSGSTASYPPVWSGKIAVAGDLTVASGYPLTIQGPAELRIADGSDYTLDVYDDFTVNGTSGDSVVFMSSAGSPDAGDWYGIRHYGPGDLSIEHTSIKHAYRAISIDDTSDVISASIRSCNIENNTVSGVMIKANPASTVTVAKSTIHDGMYGVQVYEGYVTIDSCDFSGDLRDGIRIQGAWQENKTVGGLIRGNTFQDMTYSAAKGVYLYGIEDDGRDWATEQLMQDNQYVAETADYPGQVAYVIYDCDDTLSVLRNSVNGDLDTYSIGYGIMAYRTQVLVSGDVDSTVSKSRIASARYGVYVYSSSGVSQHPVIREMSLYGGTSQTGYPYSVWVSRYGLADIGTSADYGTNVIHGSCGIKSVDTLYSVYNLNTDSIVMAVGNYWSGGVCTYGLVDASDPISYPFAAKVAITSMPGNSESAAAREDLDVLQAYPNPFNATATIRFSLSTSQKVDVTIYNILGQRVRNLWSGTKEAGEHFVEWDGRDGSGQVLASGVYLYRATTETRQIAKSIVLVK